MRAGHDRVHLAHHPCLERLDDPRLIAIGLSMTTIALVAVLFRPPVNGTRRWIDLKVMSLQPSEFAKVALALTLAKFFDESRRGSPSGTDLAVAGVLTVDRRDADGEVRRTLPRLEHRSEHLGRVAIGLTHLAWSPQCNFTCGSVRRVIRRASARRLSSRTMI